METYSYIVVYTSEHVNTYFTFFCKKYVEWLPVTQYCAFTVQYVRKSEYKSETIEREVYEFIQS